MKTKALLFLIFVSLVLGISLLVRYKIIENSKFKIFVAGHVYGGVGKDDLGIHPLFKRYFKSMGDDPLVEFGVFTGDIVRSGAVEEWDAIDSEIAELFGKPIYYAVGNHDMKNREVYEQRYGTTFHFFDHNDNRFIFLDGNLDHWNISGKQLDFFKEAIRDVEDIDNLFIFTHQVLWWTWKNKYKNTRLNSHDHYKAFPNYWEEVHPLIDSLSLPVYVIAGDVGAGKWASNYAYDQVDNVHLLVSGMGENKGDNFIEISFEQGEAEIQIRYLIDGAVVVPDSFIIVN